MHKMRLALACVLLIISTSSNATLIFSEYVEGSSYNKALEIFNTGETVDFSVDDYAIDIYTNGATSPRYSISLSGILDSGETLVIGHSRADTLITSIADILSGNLSFNGDDAITLSFNGVVVDRIGQIGVDPGSEWGTDLTSTQNNTLRRNENVTAGDIDPLLAFNPVNEWQGFLSDEFSGLGEHILLLAENPIQSGTQTSVPLPGSNALIAAGLLPLLISALVRRNSRRNPVVA